MTVGKRSDRKWQIKDGSIDFRGGTKVMGILNVTPDSFSDGGKFNSIDAAIAKAEKMIEAGAEIVDIGGESTRPGGQAVDEETEKRRVLPIIEEVSRRIRVPVSVDTSKASVAEAAVDHGARIVNDISGLKFDTRMTEVIESSGCGVVLMHLFGNDSATMHSKKPGAEIAREVVRGLKLSIAAAENSGVKRGSICLDVGFGFGKTHKQNLALLKDLSSISDCFPGMPMLVGVSRKSFIGEITGEKDPEKRMAGTIAMNCIAVLKGADLLRVHDVKETVDAVKVLEVVRGLR